MFDRFFREEDVELFTKESVTLPEGFNKYVTENYNRHTHIECDPFRTITYRSKTISIHTLI